MGVNGAASPKAPAQAPEQARYATVLVWGTRLGLAVLAFSFAAQVFGWLPSLVPPEQLPGLWNLPIDRYRALTGSPAGWGWVAQLGHGDMAGVAGIAILAGCSVPCLLALLPLYSARRDRAFVAICLAEAVVIALAATGWLAGGH